MHLVTNDIGQYRAVADGNDDKYSHRVYEPFARDYIGPGMTPAQAGIIAFALNAIREGKLLAAMDPQWRGSAYHAYEGPTEGVAPNKPGIFDGNPQFGTEADRAAHDVPEEYRGPRP